MLWPVSLILVLVSLPTYAQFSGGERLPEIKAKIRKLIEGSGIKKQNLGIYITDNFEGSSKVTFEQNSLRMFIPASTTKIFTAGAALEKFPIGHKFITRLMSPAKVSGGILQGDLYLTGGGDPGFVSEKMWFLVNEFKRNKITQINGNLVVDDHLFDQVRYDPGRDPNRRDRAYDSPIGAMTFNWSVANIFVRPGKKAGDPVEVFADPESSYINVTNKATTGNSKSGQRLKVSRLKKSPEDKSVGDTVVVAGSLAAGHPEKVFFKSISQPDFFAGYHLREFLKQRGISVKGKVTIGRTPQGAKPLAEVESRSVGDLVRDMMKFSNNYVAEILTKNLAAVHAEKPGTMEKGLGIINDYIQSKGITPSDYVLSSPSGLSRKNRFRPVDIHKILVNLKSNFAVFAEFLASNPIGGVDGTLKSRMKSGPAFGRVRAKSGHLNGVSSLAGYMGREDGHELSFVYMYNGPAVKVPRAKKLFDLISATLLK